MPIDVEQLLEACRREGARRVLAFDEYGESLWPRTDWLALHVLPDSLGTQVVAEPLTALDPEPWSTVAESAPLAADGLTALTLCCLEEQLQWPSRLWLLPPRGCARPPMLLADGLRGGWMPPAASAAGLGAPRLATPASWGRGRLALGGAPHAGGAAVPPKSREEAEARTPQRLTKLRTPSLPTAGGRAISSSRCAAPRTATCAWDTTAS